MSDSVDLLRKIVELRPGGEHRPAQEQAVEAIELAIDEKHNALVEAPTGTGKALEVSTPILTTQGWKAMGELVEGDIIFDEQGRQTQVLVAHDPFISAEAYRVKFSDGTEIVADAEHLWATTTRSSRQRVWDSQKLRTPLVSREQIQTYRGQIESFAENLPTALPTHTLARKLGLSTVLLERATSTLTPVDVEKKHYSTTALLEALYQVALNEDRLRSAHGVELQVSTTREIKDTLFHRSYRNHAIPILSSALDLPEADLLIEPYTLGAWLGDGASNGGQIATADLDLLENLQADGYFTAKVKDKYSYALRVSPEAANNRWHDSFTKRLGTLGVQHNKHIPSAYMLASAKQREALLAGLLDTDGYIDRNGIYEFCVTNERLANDVFELVASLGYKPSFRRGTAMLNGRRISDKWTVSFLSDVNYFRIERKRLMFIERYAKRKVTPLRNDLRYIIGMEEVQSPMVRCITVDSPNHLFLAGRSLVPTHNTLSYLIPLFVTKKKAVISTATKQLSEQIIKQDVPTLRRALRQVDPSAKLNAALLKGRENYFCLYKEDQGATFDRQAEERMPVFDEPEEKAPSSTSAAGRKLIKEISSLKDWAAETQSGDRSEAPVVSDQIWRQFSATATECIGRNQCPFGEICFAERARDKARKSDIVVTNHAVVGHDLMAEDEGILGERAVYVFDELHELDNYLSNAWGTRLTAKMIRDSHKAFAAYKELGQSAIDVVEQAAKRFEPALESMDEGLITTMPSTMDTLVRNLYKATSALGMSAGKLMKESDTGENAKKALNVLKKRAEELAEACLILLDDSMETVRWKTASEAAGESLNAAPLRVGPRLQLALAARDAIMIGTSATITVAGAFDIPVHNLDLENAGDHREYRLDTPFNYPKQAMLYIPDPDSFPAPVGSDRAEHSRAILSETADLVKAAGGRALVLSTTTSGAGYLARHLRKKFPKMKILLQGEAPNPQLVDEFKKDKKSCLVATMGMWHGLDVVGDANILVVMDKVPFKPMNDPLSVARQNYAESQGRSGFMDVYVADANVMLAQGAGRLIRSKDDKGVIAILDTRLLTKRYGKDMLKSLPPLMNRPRGTIIEGLERLAKMIDEKK